MGIVQERKSKRKEAIVQASRALIRKHGVSSVTLDMVAKDVGLSRPNFYRFFKNKSALLAAVVGEEAAEINARRHKEVMRLRSFDKQIIRSMELAVEIVENDAFWSLLIEPNAVRHTAYAASTDPDILQSNVLYWQPILETAATKGILRRELDHQKIMTWLLGVQFMFMERREIFPTLRDVREYSETFVLPALKKDR